MTTLEMLNKAQKTNKTYLSGKDLSNMRYSVFKGFHNAEGRKWDGKAFEYVNEIFDLDN